MSGFAFILGFLGVVIAGGILYVSARLLEEVR